MISSIYFQDLKLSGHDDDGEERDESNKTTTQTLPYDTLNQLDDTTGILEVENIKNPKIRQEVVQEARQETSTD